MDRKTSFHPLRLILRDDIPLGVAIFVKVVAYVFQLQAHRLILFQREIKEISIVRLLNDTATLFEELLIHL